MKEDVREKASLNHQEVVRLNFVRDPGTYIFRRHYKQGLRSHVMEVLRRDDVERERAGVVIEGIRWFPKAKPIKMLRIFRSRFNSLDEALEEARSRESRVASELEEKRSQLDPVSQLPTMRESSSPSCSDGTRVCDAH